MKRFLMIGVIALGLAGCATLEDKNAPPPTVDVTGRWAGQWSFVNAALGSGQIEMTVAQTGAKVSGNMNVSGAPVDRTGPVSGLVSGNQLQILYPTSITGRLTVQGDTISGQIDGLNPANVTLKKVR